MAIHQTNFFRIGGDIAFLKQESLPSPFFVWRICFRENQNSQNDNQPGAGQIPEDSIHPQKGHLQEFYRVNVIKRHPIAERYMDDITTVDIANYRDQRLAQINLNGASNNRKHRPS